MHERDQFLLLLLLLLTSVTHAQRGVLLYGENGREIYTDHPSWPWWKGELSHNAATAIWEFRNNGGEQNTGPILSSDQVSTYDREEAPFIKEIIFDPCYALQKTPHTCRAHLYFISCWFVSLYKFKLIIPLLKWRKYNKERFFSKNIKIFT